MIKYQMAYKYTSLENNGCGWYLLYFSALNLTFRPQTYCEIGISRQAIYNEAVADGYYLFI